MLGESDREQIEVVLSSQVMGRIGHAIVYQINLTKKIGR
jgi:hypothetical protein